MRTPFEFERERAEAGVLLPKGNKPERQNTELRQRLANGDYAGGGFEALTSLYEDGFHVCPGSFGQSREDECIFCLNFLLHKGKK